MYITGKKRLIGNRTRVAKTKFLCSNHFANVSFTKWAQCYLYISYRPKNAQTKEKKPLKFTTHCAIGICTSKYFVLLLYFKYSIFFHNIYQYNSWFYRWFYNIVLSCKYWSTDCSPPSWLLRFTSLCSSTSPLFITKMTKVYIFSGLSLILLPLSQP